MPELKRGTGVGVMILRDGKILLGKRHDDPEKADSAMEGQGTWTMPGGKMDFGESFEDTAERETREENSIRVNRDKLQLVSLTNDIVADKAHFVTIGMLCEDFEGEPQVLEPDEITEWRWFPLDALPEKVFEPSRKIINNYLDKTIYKH